MEQQTRPMSKQHFRIGELAKILSVEKYVVRFWEREFSLSSTRSEGGQRFYTVDDVEQFKRIKALLYKEGFTIAGARKQLELEQRTKQPRNRKTEVLPQDDLHMLKAQLLKLKELL